MINITSFLNSKDIADYWRRIGFICTPLQSAYIVWQNHTKTLQEKHAAWREIVETMPDCIVAEGHRKTNMGISDALAESLHAFLRAFMQLQNQLIERFYRKGDHAVYSYRVLYDGDKDWSEDRWLYDTAEECFEDVNADEDLIPSIVCIQLTKQWIGENRALTLSVKVDKTVIDIEAQELDEEEHDLLQAFDWMWFDFPTPFKKGDIVVSKYSPWGWNLYADEPFVLMLLCSWGSKEYKVNGIPEKMGCYKTADGFREYHRKNADGTDMTAHGYFQNEDGSVYWECMHHYLDLEYYRKEPKGIRRILKAFSSFEKGEIGSDLLAIAYHTIMEEERIKREKKQLSCFTDEGLRLAGLK